MQFQALGFSKGPFYVYTFINIRPLSENTFTWIFCSHNVKFLASPACHPLANECCFYDTHQAQLWEFMFLPPGWMTTSLMSCGSKAPGHWGRCVWVGRTFGLTAPNFSLFSPIFFFSFEFAHQACCEEWTIFIVHGQWTMEGQQVTEHRWATRISPHTVLVWKDGVLEEDARESWHQKETGVMHLSFGTLCSSRLPPQNLTASRCQTGRKT